MGFMYVSCDHYAPGNIVTDHGKVFTSRRWKRVCSYLSVNRRLSTAFYPQTDGQTEWQNQTMQKYLQAFCIYEQDNWVTLLSLAQFAYNNSIHHSMQITPFWTNCHYHPPMQFKPLKALSNIRSEIQARWNSIGNGRESPASPGELVGSPGRALTICWWEGHDSQGWNQSVAPDSTLLNNQMMKDTRLQPHLAIYSK